MNEDMEEQTLSPGGFWVRGGAQLVDAILLGFLINWPLRWILIKVGVGLWTLNLALLLVGAILVISFWAWRGATPGKMLCSLKIVRSDNGGSPGLGQWIGRYAAYFVSTLPMGLGFFWAGWNPEKRAWHDLLAGTRVVRTDTSPRARKKAWIVVGLSGVVALGSFLVVIGFAATRALSKGRMESFQKAVEESRTFGQGREDRACLDEAVRRAVAATGSGDMVGALKNQVFLNDCLKSALPTEAFCEDVPAENDVANRVQWSLSRAQAAGIDTKNPFQRLLFDGVARECEKRRRENKNVSK
jgi:uncharacterized RDD family membrane protein YckC